MVPFCSMLLQYTLPKCRTQGIESYYAVYTSDHTLDEMQYSLVVARISISICLAKKIGNS